MGRLAVRIKPNPTTSTNSSERAPQASGRNFWSISFRRRVKPAPSAQPLVNGAGNSMTGPGLFPLRGIEPSSCSQLPAFVDGSRGKSGLCSNHSAGDPNPVLTYADLQEQAGSIFKETGLEHAPKMLIDNSVYVPGEGDAYQFKISLQKRDFSSGEEYKDKITALDTMYRSILDAFKSRAGENKIDFTVDNYSAIENLSMPSFMGARDCKNIDAIRTEVAAFLTKLESIGHAMDSELHREKYMLVGSFMRNFIAALEVFEICIGSKNHRSHFALPGYDRPDPLYAHVNRLTHPNCEQVKPASSGVREKSSLSLGALQSSAYPIDISGMAREGALQSETGGHSNAAQKKVEELKQQRLERRNSAAAEIV